MVLYRYVYYVTVIIKVLLVGHWLRFSSLLNFRGWRNHWHSHSCDRGKFMPMKVLNVDADVSTCAGKDNISPHEQVLYSWWQEKWAGIFSHSSVWLYLHLYSMFYGYNYVLDAWYCQILFNMNVFGIHAISFLFCYLLHTYSFHIAFLFIDFASFRCLVLFFLALTFEVFQLPIFSSYMSLTIFSHCFLVLSLQLKFRLVLILTLVLLCNP